MADNKSNAAEKKPSFFKGLKAEFKKIIWPDRESLVREVVAVIVVSVVLCVVIAVLDSIISTGIGFLMK